MPSAALALLTGAVAIAILLVPLRVAFATVVAAVVLVPASLPLPNPVTSYVSVTRLLVVALAVKLLLAVRSGEAPRDAWRWTVLHTAFVVFLTAVFVSGVVLASSARPGV